MVKSIKNPDTCLKNNKKGVEKLLLFFLYNENPTIVVGFSVGFTDEAEKKTPNVI